MIKSVKKALDILTILSANAETPIALSELSAQTGLNKSTCSHIVDTMCETMYVERVSRKEGYRLGPWSYMLSRYGTYHQSLIKTASSVMRWLQEQTEATVFISVICNGQKYIVYHIDNDNILPMSDGSMIQGYMETTATGRLLMAYLDSDALRHCVRKRNQDMEDVLSPELEQELKAIRQHGYAHCSVDVQQTQSFAFRIMEGSKTVASVGVLYPNDKDSLEFRQTVIKAGKTAASEISRRLAFK